MTLIREGRVSPDSYQQVRAGDELPPEGDLLVDLETWQDQWQSLTRRNARVGVRLASDEHPEIIADDLDQLDLVALDFPSFRDGRAYSYARLLRKRYGFTGELRAVGDVLPDQLLFMHRVGFDAFDVQGDSPAEDFDRALKEFSVFYQAAADQRSPALRLRHARG